MKKAIAILLAAFPLLAKPQAEKNWLQVSDRQQNYPSGVYFTGFASDELLPGESQNDAVARVTEMARGEVTKSVRVEVNVATQHRATSTKVNESEEFKSIYEKTVNTIAKITFTGLTTENYIAGKTIYAFAYVNKSELKGNYSAVFNMNMQQLESMMNTAKQLEDSGEKAKARTQYEEAVPLLAKVEDAQDVLAALGSNLQSAKTATYHSEIVLALARLAQGVYIYVENNETLFGQKVDIVANKVKSGLAANGCSFVDNAKDADFQLKINVSVRLNSNDNGIAFCYADAAVELYDNHKQKVMYSDEFSQKGGSNTQEKAGRDAMEKIVPKIVEKLKNWVNN